MKLNEVFPSNYLKSDDLQGKETTVVISGASMETVGNDQRLVLSFQGKTKTMICNKTNANRIAFLYGDDTDGWIGKAIKLTSEFVEFQGKTVKGLRVKPPNTNGNHQSINAPLPSQQAQGSYPARVAPPHQPVIQERTNYTLSGVEAAPSTPYDDEIPF